MRQLLLLVSMLTVVGCAGPLKTPSGDSMPRTGQPPEGPEIPALCSPTCAAGLEKLQQCWLRMLTESGPAGGSVRAPGHGENDPQEGCR